MQPALAAPFIRFVFFYTCTSHCKMQLLFNNPSLDFSAAYIKAEKARSFLGKWSQRALLNARMEKNVAQFKKGWREETEENVSLEKLVTSTSEI